MRKAIGLMVLCTLFTSAGQLLWKYGLQEVGQEGWRSLLNVPFFLGFFSYGLGAILLLLAFRRGELTVLYPILATSYIWVSLLSPFFFVQDSMNVWKWAGLFFIFASVSLLGYGSTQKGVKPVHG